MNQSVLSVRVNSNDKKDFETFCNDTGMNVSTAINLFIKTVLREKKLPFEVKTYDDDNDVYLMLKEAEEQIEDNKEYDAKEVLKSVNDIIRWYV